LRRRTCWRRGGPGWGPPGPAVPGRVQHRRVTRQSRTRRRRRQPRAAAAAAAAASGAAPGSATGSVATCARARTAAPRSRSLRMCALSLSVVREARRARALVHNCQRATCSGLCHVQGLQCCAWRCHAAALSGLGRRGWAVRVGKRNREAVPTNQSPANDCRSICARLPCMHAERARAAAPARPCRRCACRYARRHVCVLGGRERGRMRGRADAARAGQRDGAGGGAGGGHAAAGGGLLIGLVR